MRDSTSFSHFLFTIMAHFEKDPNKLRLNAAHSRKLITDEQYERIKEYLNSEEDDVYNLGVKTLKAIIKKSAI